MNQEINYQMYHNADDHQITKSTTPITKRSDKATFKDRFSKIVSVYIPNDDAEKILLKFDDDMEQETQEPYPRTLLQSLDDGLCYQVEFLGSWQDFLGRKGGKVLCSCVFKSIMYVVFDGESQIFRLIVSEKQIKCDSIWFPKIQNLSLFPTEIRCTNNAIYISGKIEPLEGTIQYIIVKYDMNESVIAYTKRYNYPKFGNFDIDRDGNLIILRPKIGEDGINSQIAKLSSEFDSVQYYISMGDDNYQYVPLHVAAHGFSRTWVSLKKQSVENSEKSEHRLMCFRCCIQKTNGDKNQLRAALESSRWKMDGFSLGPLAVLNNHILAIDEVQHNLCYITWKENEGHPVVKKISSPNSPYLVNMCSNSTDYAFLFTENSVFKFQFQEQLIKN